MNQKNWFNSVYKTDILYPEKNSCQIKYMEKCYKNINNKR